MNYIELAFVVVCVVAVVQAVSARLPVPTPLLLVIAGVLLSAFARLDSLHEQAPLLFVVLVPPLLYIEAWLAPRHELWRAWVPVLGLSIGLVALTIVAVAYGSRALLPGLTLATAFAMASALAPTDTIAVTTLTRRSRVAMRLKTILNGEGLFNDAVALVAFQLAVAAAVSGQVTLERFAARLLFVGVGGAAVGAGTAVVGFFCRRHLKSDAEDHAAVDVLLSLMTPYAAFLAAEKVGVSGVLAVVVAGLCAGTLDQRHLSDRLRTEGKSVWTTLSLAFNGAVFVLLGLEIRQVLGRLPLGFWELAADVGLLTTALLVVRAAWLALAIFVFRMKVEADPRHETRARRVGQLLVSSCCGVRGSLSLTAALSMPLVTASGAAFPGRDLIVALVAGTVLSTLAVHAVASMALQAAGLSGGLASAAAGT